MIPFAATLATLFAPPAGMRRTLAQLVAYDLACVLWEIGLRSDARRCATATAADWQEIADACGALAGHNPGARDAARRATEILSGARPVAVAARAFHAVVPLAALVGETGAEWEVRCNRELDALAALQRFGATVEVQGSGRWWVEYDGEVVVRGRELGDVAVDAAREMGLGVRVPGESQQQVAL